MSKTPLAERIQEVRLKRIPMSSMWRAHEPGGGVRDLNVEESVAIDYICSQRGDHDIVYEAGLIRADSLYELHAARGPALVVKTPDGWTREWYRFGRRHRDHDRPAEERASGDRFWYREGLLHRDGDKPAMIDSSGDQQWFVDGKSTVLQAPRSPTSSASSGGLTARTTQPT